MGTKTNRKTYVVCMWHSLWKLSPHQGGIENRYVLAHSDDVVVIELHPKTHFSRWPPMMATSSVTSPNDYTKLRLGWGVIYVYIVVRWSMKRWLSFDKWVQSLLYMHVYMHVYVLRDTILLLQNSLLYLNELKTSDDLLEIEFSGILNLNRKKL